jgi:hypothetical protein
MKINTIAQCGLLVGALISGFCGAKVSPEEAANLGGSLTPIGAEKAGNADGSIPAWDGGLTKPPSGFNGRDYLNPFAGEKPLFEITAANADQYKDKLSVGQLAMLKRYSTYKIKVYPTHRTAGYDQKVYDAAKKNALVTDLVDGGYGISGYNLTLPFPVPHGTASEKAYQLMWNHVTRWRDGSFQRNVVQMTPLISGSYSPVKFEEQITFLSSLTDFQAGKSDPNILFYFKQSIVSPARLAGNVLLVHETLNQVKEPRRAWVYNSGQRRVRRAPQVAYDGPGTAADGQRTSDNFDMFNGATDRYDWKLVGKKEVYIPYNTYDLTSTSKKYDDIIKPGHINQDLTRYELHRVWVVEATLKEGSRHIYAKRVFYIDEDTWQIALVDHYDGRGELWRVAEGHHMQFYDRKISWYSAECLYDLLSGRYLVLGLSNEEPVAYQWDIKTSSKDFTPAALRRAGKR